MFTELLNKLVKINSISMNEKKISDFIFNYFSSLGFKTIKQFVEKDRANIVVEKGEGKKTIILYSHLDTVNVVSGWNTNPFNIKVIDDKIYGLGAWDMKGGMTVNILNFLNYKPKNFKLKIIFCVDEESDSKGAFAFSKSKMMNNVDCVLSTEPAFKYGLSGIVTGRIGRAVYQIKVKGESKHTAFYEKIYDINFFVAELLKSINRLNKEKNGQKQYLFASKIESSSIGMSLPEKTFLTLETGIIPPTNHDQILRKLKNITKALNKKYKNYYTISVDLAKRNTPYLESYQTSKKNKYFKYLSKSIKKVTKNPAIPYFRSSVADENVFGSKGKTVLGIGPVGGNAHAPNEWVSLRSLEKLYNIIRDFLKRIDKISL